MGGSHGISCAGKGMSVVLYRRATAIGGCGREHAPFLVLHAFAVHWCLSTMGQPLAAAEEARSELEWKLRTELEDGQDFDESRLPALPSVLQPDFWALFCLVAFLCLHGLMVLGKGWSVRFCAALTYSSSDLDSADTVMVVPRKHRGKAELVDMHWTAELDGKRRAFFIFQRRKWLLNGAGVFEKLPVPVDWPLYKYHEASGLSAEAEVNAARELYGPNRFELPSPTFLPMFKKQLSQPLSVFQLFSVLLWCLDDYWQYSLFTFAMMLLFEGTVVFSRLKSMSVLRGMGNEARQVHVHRSGKWVQISTEELLPGDIVSIIRAEKAEVVPADVLVLRGTAVVNEATLTGESVPQMKEALPLAGEPEEEQVGLNLKGMHKLHIMYSGSTVMQHSKGAPTGGVGGKLTSPDGGCVCYVLRTGFLSSQGKLVRMIEFSSENVSGDQREAGLLLGFLLFFALTASGYVLKRGLEDKSRSQYDLLLHCILIITSVIPPELPMQTALAVNSSIVTLMKSQIFCTEPFRIPNAGKLDTCLFDKTGTITTDELTAVGVASWSGKPSQGTVESRSQPVTAMVHAPVPCCAVLAGCQSLVDIDGKLMGDPVEEAAIKAICWKYDGAKGIATPDTGSPWSKTAQGSGPVPRVEVLQRHHFASKLQRMSVVASVQPGGMNPNGTATTSQLWCLVKGSPEKVRTLLSDAPGCVPPWYDATHEKLARDGMRVIAMAYRRIENGNITYSEAKSKPRSWVESDLTFAGFVAFRCLVRRDSAQVLNELQASGHRVIMITGDAALTGIHVAAETDIITTDRSRVLVLSTAETAGNDVVWKNAETGDVTEFDANSMPNLSSKCDLVMTGQTLTLASELQPAVWDHLRCVKVFARMAPEEKEKVISSINTRGHFTMMMGDGANDVGALKQAHVGCALLTGFGSINVDRRSDTVTEDGIELPTVPGRESRVQKARAERKEVLMQQPVASVVTGLRTLGSKPSEDGHCFEKEELVELLLDMEAKHQADAALIASGEKQPKSVAQTPAQKRAAMFAKRKNELQDKARERKAEADRKIQALRDRGGGMMEVMQLTKQLAQEEMQAAKDLAAGAAGQGFEASAAINAALMDPDMDDLGLEAPMVKLGDASIASPFTSKMPSIKAALDIIRQGRCTLLTTVQMYMILALNCLISAYSLSVLYLDGIKYGDKQMTATGILMSISFITISQAGSLPQLSSVRPLTSVFHPAMFCSLVGQFCVHLSTMIYAHGMAKPLMPANFEVDLRELDEEGNNTFKPSILNTVIFYMSTMQQVCVFAVNYKGRPFMQGLTENAPLLYSLGLCGTLAVACATELFPRFNAYLQLEPLPDVEFRNTILGLLALDVTATLVWDRFMSWIFASHIFAASMEGWSRNDVTTMLKVAGIAGTVIWWLGNNVETLEELEKEMAEMDIDPEDDEEAAVSMAVQAASGPGGELLRWWFGDSAVDDAVGKVEQMLGEDMHAAAAAGARCGPGTRWDAETELCVLD